MLIGFVCGHFYHYLEFELPANGYKNLVSTPPMFIKKLTSKFLIFFNERHKIKGVDGYQERVRREERNDNWRRAERRNVFQGRAQRIG